MKSIYLVLFFGYIINKLLHQENTSEKSIQKINLYLHLLGNFVFTILKLCIILLIILPIITIIIPIAIHSYNIFNLFILLLLLYF